MNFLIVLLLSIQGVYAGSEGLSPQEIISRSDEVRNPAKPFQMNNKLTEYVNGSARSEMTLAIYSKEDRKSGQFRNLVRYVDPPRDSGKIVLLDGSKMWFYDPASKASVRISPQQRLIGQASEGDVVTANFAKDYKAKLIGNETLDDADRIARKCWHLGLLPSKDDAIYGRIEYWVEVGTYRPVKGKFYSDSGRLLKIAYYHKYEEQLGTLRPTEVIIIDAVNSKLVTTMNFAGYRTRDISDSWFQREFLPHLRVE